MVASMVGGSLATSALVAGDVCDELVRASPDCIQVITLEGRLEFINEHGLSLLEIEDITGLAGAPWSSLWPEEEREKVATAVSGAMAGGRERFQGLCPTFTGAPKWWDVIVSPVRNARGDIDALLAVSRDITAIKAVEERLDGAVKIAATASRIKDEFLANLSHEIRTPLTSILGFAELAASSDRPASEGKAYVDRIAQAGDSLLHLVNDLIDLACADAGTLTIHPAPCNLELSVTSIVDRMRPMAGRKLIDVVLEFDPRLSGFFDLDQQRVQQVVANLVTNAVKFTDIGTVTVAVSQTDDDPAALLIAVTDTGAGIPDALLPTLFDRFTQADSSLSRRHGGAGLGLAISKNLVILMGGQIGAQSAVDAGATFWFTLPMARAEPPLAPPVQAVSEQAPLRVLVADDNEANRRLLSAFLEAGGHNVVLAVDGGEALKLVGATKFDVVLMDIQMPVMDGVTAIKAMRAGATSNSQTPIIAITANVMADQLDSYLAAGANACISKPFNARAVLEGLAAVTAGKAPSDEMDTSRG